MGELAFRVEKKRWPKWVAIGVLLLGGYFAYTFGIPYVAAYEVRLAARLACTSYIRAAKSSSYDDDKAEWKREFLARAGSSGVRLSPENFLFELDDERDHENTWCVATVAYDASTEWPLTDVLGLDLAPLKTTHRFKIEHKVLKRF